MSASSVLDLEKEVESTGFSAARILEMLEPHFSALSAGRKVVNISASDVSGGKGGCSRVLRVVVHFEDDRPTFSCVLKIPSADTWKTGDNDEEIADSLHTLERMHNAECEALELLAAIRPAGFPTARLFHAERRGGRAEGVIVMEDLNERGESPARFFAAPLPLCFEVAAHLAELQTAFHFSPEAKQKAEYFWENGQTTSLMMRIQTAAIRKLAASDDRELAEKASIFAKLDLRRLTDFAFVECSQQLGANAFCHGDLWMGNLFITPEKAGTTDDACHVVAFIDWQGAFIGNPLSDLADFLAFSTEPAVRRANDRSIVDFFFDLLRRKFEERGGRLNFTREQAQVFYELDFVVAVFALVLGFVAFGRAFENSERPEERRDFEFTRRRLRCALEDALPLIQKHELMKRFAFSSE
ncbi:putative oxidoreductase-like protein [Aphelenchoides fujianensis]|nr:putative oxidoreductase-like protein [Aphelenchoides fujianensis]